MHANWDSPGLGGVFLFVIIYGFICYFTPLEFNLLHAISIGIIGLYLGTVIGIQDELFFYTYFPLLTFLLVIINTPLSPKDGMVTAAILFVLFIIGTVLPFNDTFRGWMKPEIYHLNEKKENHNFVVMGRTKGFILILAIVFTYLVIIYYY